MGFHFSIPISVLRSVLRYTGDPSAFLRLPGSTVPHTSPPLRVVCCPLAHSSCFSCVNWPWLTLLTQASPAGFEKDSLPYQPCDEDIRKPERDADRASFHSPSTKKLKTAWSFKAWSCLPYWSLNFRTVFCTHSTHCPPALVLELGHFVCSLVICSISSLVGETPGHRCGLRGRNVLWNHVRVCSGTHNSLTNWTLPCPSVNTGPRASESTEGGSIFNILKLC